MCCRTRDGCNLLLLFICQPAAALLLGALGPPLKPEQMDTNNDFVHIKHRGLSVELNNLHGHADVRMSSPGGKLSRQ